MSPKGGKRPGAGRKRLQPDEKGVTVAFVLPPELVTRLDALAGAEGKSRSTVLVEILRRSLGFAEMLKVSFGGGK
jgi:predicted DNA-binding protein